VKEKNQIIVNSKACTGIDIPIQAFYFVTNIKGKNEIF
jgi:hypothetical protein